VFGLCLPQLLFIKHVETSKFVDLILGELKVRMVIQNKEGICLGFKAHPWVAAPEIMGQLVIVFIKEVRS
jgi:hypothetical protein